MAVSHALGQEDQTLAVRNGGDGGPPRGVVDENRGEIDVFCVHTDRFHEPACMAVQLIERKRWNGPVFFDVSTDSVKELLAFVLRPGDVVLRRSERSYCSSGIFAHVLRLHGYFAVGNPPADLLKVISPGAGFGLSEKLHGGSLEP